MKLTVTFQDDPSTAKDLVISKKLGRGKFDVFYGKNFFPDQEYAIKIFSKTDFAKLHYTREKTLLASLSHPNIIKYYTILTHSADFDVLVMEYAPYGDFFEIVTKKGLDHDVYIRTYFQQLIAGIEYLHSKGIAHLDLKLENLLLGQDFQLKISDFDNSQIRGEKRLVYTGTNGYRAPEVLDKTCKDIFAADIFSAGVLLYTFKICQFPFVEIQEQGKVKLLSYDLFLKNRDEFWQVKAKSLGQKPEFFCKDFRKLLKGMLAKDPAKRMTIKDIKASEWYNGPILQGDSLKVHMNTVWRKILQSQVKKRSKS